MVTVKEERYTLTGQTVGTAFGLSSDEKPIWDEKHNGYEFHEMDTGNVYIYDQEGKTWRYWKKEGGGGGGENVATNEEANDVLDDVFGPSGNGGGSPGTGGTGGDTGGGGTASNSEAGDILDDIFGSG